MKNKYDSLHILCRNGWTWHSYETDPIIKMAASGDDYFVYTNTFLGLYETKIMAAVSEHSGHLCVDGHYGVLWLATVEYECNPPHSKNDLEDMMAAIGFAEDHLLKIGMPFTPDYQFSGRNAANKKRRNDKLRKIYNLDEMEEKASE